MSSLRLLNKQQQGFLAMNSPDLSALTVVRNEVDVLAALLPLQQLARQGQAMAMIELGCGNARLARDLLRQSLVSQVTGLEVDERQHAKNLAQPQDGLAFLQASAAAVPCADASFDLALMLKSLHHVPLPDMAQALDEVARVLRPGGWLYVSEPVYEGALNEVVKLFNDEGVVRAAAQAALDAALAQPGSPWTQVATHRFDTPVHYASAHSTSTPRSSPKPAPSSRSSGASGEAWISCCSSQDSRRQASSVTMKQTTSPVSRASGLSAA